jgi:hypothetical protein
MIVNRTSKVVDPRTRKTRIRPNPEKEWVMQPVPELRIIDDDLWLLVQKRREALETVPWNKQVRPKRLLSELGECGICGSTWILISGDRWGCAGYQKGGKCCNNRTITNERYEARVLDGLQERMLDPEAVSLFVREYHQEYGRQVADLGKRRDKLERQHTDAVTKVNRLVEAIASGAGEFVEVKEFLSKARLERDRSLLSWRRLTLCQWSPSIPVSPMSIASK